MTMRPFTEPQERALARLREQPPGRFLDVTRERPSVYQRLSDLGLATVTLHRRQTRARLTETGWYFARLLPREDRK